MFRHLSLIALASLAVVSAHRGTFGFAESPGETLATKIADADPMLVWPQWRGPSQRGIAPEGTYPLNWSDETTKSVEIPGSGGSTPVIAGDLAYLTSGIDGKNYLLAIDLKNDSILWKTPLGEDRGNKHRKGSGSNPSPVTDGSHIAAYFRSGDLACVDPEGEVVWHTNIQDQFGEDTLWWDLGSSPLLIDSMVVVAVMQTGPSYLVAFDLESGEMKWKTDRITDAPEEAAQSYATPLEVTVDGRSLIAVMGADHLTLHSVNDGKELARLGGFNPDEEKFFRSIASPVAEGNIIVCPYSRGATLTAVDMSKLLAGKGKEAIVWFRDDLGSDVPTPSLRNGVLYVVSDAKHNKGTVHAVELDSGETVWTTALPRTRKSYSSSPLIASDRLYVTDENGRTSVVGPLATASSTSPPTVIASNPVNDDEPFTVASPVPMMNGIALRTKNRLYLTEANTRGSDQ